MKRLHLGLRPLLLCCATACCAIAQGRPPEPAAWPLATVFPGTPEIREATLNDNGIVYSAVASMWKDHVHYEVDRTALARTTPPRDVYWFYEAIKKAVIESHNAEFIEETKIRICGHPALRYVLEYGGRRLEFHDVLLKADGRMEDYRFSCDFPIAAQHSAPVTAFFSGIIREAPPPPGTNAATPAGALPKSG